MATTFFDEGMLWLPLADGARERATFIEVLEGVKREFPDQEPFSADWFPFARDLLGNVVVVDVAKDEVFYFDHAEGRAEGDAPSSEAFLADLLGALESGARVIDPKVGTVDPSPPPARVRAARPGPKANPAVLVGMALVVVALLALTLLWEAFGR